MYVVQSGRICWAIHRKLRERSVSHLEQGVSVCSRLLPNRLLPSCFYFVFSKPCDGEGVLASKIGMCMLLLIFIDKIRVPSVFFRNFLEEGYVWVLKPHYVKS